MEGFDVSSDGVAKGLVAASSGVSRRATLLAQRGWRSWQSCLLWPQSSSCSCINSAGVIPESTETSPP